MKRFFCFLFGHKLTRLYCPDAGAFYQHHRPCLRCTDWVRHPRGVPMPREDEG